MQLCISQSVALYEAQLTEAECGQSEVNFGGNTEKF